MIVIDTSVWVDYFNNVTNAYTDWVSLNLYSGQIALTDLILCEILQGIRDEKRFKQVEEGLRRLSFVSAHGVEIAAASARNYRALRQQGITIRKFVDIWTATTCIERGHLLLHRDRDYDPFEKHLGLRVIHP
jgi:predicted nucleic acid-binding protein